MPITQSEYLDVRMRAEELQCHSPSGLAILPLNFASAIAKSDLVHSNQTSAVRKLWRMAGLHETKIDPEGERFPEQHLRSFEWLGPTIFVGASLAIQDQNTISIALNIISTYLTDFFKGTPKSSHVVKFDVVQEEEIEGYYSYKKFSYEGSVEGVRELESFLESQQSNES